MISTGDKDSDCIGNRDGDGDGDKDRGRDAGGGENWEENGMGMGNGDSVDRRGCDTDEKTGMKMGMVMRIEIGMVMERDGIDRQGELATTQVNAVQVCESGVVLEEIPVNLGDSIAVQISAENERIEG